MICSVTCSDVIVLTGDNFDQETQAGKGSNTGDWLIEFYAPWCGHCKTLAPIWETIATDLKGEINVAKVDVTTNGPLGKRYDVKGFPTILLFSKGKTYKYRGKRTAQLLSAFARGGFKDTEGTPVPLQPGLVEELIERVTSTWKRAKTDVEKKNYFTLNTFALIAPILLLLVSLLYLFDQPEEKSQRITDKTKETTIKDKKTAASASKEESNTAASSVEKKAD
eukprot:CAMPEP_0182428848 /NCGR_PEP_ID=MMETSP1167-20130531/24160_1 /TAXON_ID=2988 /ORGANISM="Mallomonas Sp, Strain CCMP3275" /LENGTH=222 /DNA_ID=CAMNT_0024612013 /DNA_START=140 /DNA_END=808 /DNA_ORIENTATION=+